MMSYSSYSIASPVTQILSRLSTQKHTTQQRSIYKRAPTPTGGPQAALFLFIIIFLQWICFYPAFANTKEFVTINDAESGSLLIETDQAEKYYFAPTVNTDVEMGINGLVARVIVTQHFTNPASDWVNGIYVFPLPEKAAVDHMQLIISERII
jgi:hypothetical protein